MTISLNDLSAAQLNNAAAIKERIEALEKELAGIISGSVISPSEPEPVAVADGTAPRRRKMSAAARARISAAAKARWARERATDNATASPTPPRKKFKMSPEGRARIVAAQKARWAKIKAAKK